MPLGAGGFALGLVLPNDRVSRSRAPRTISSRARLAREADALPRSARRAVPTPPRSEGSWTDGDALYGDGSRCDGTSVADLTTSPVRIRNASPSPAGLLRSLDRIHAARFVHRDLKPDNLFRTGNGVVILDLGLPRELPTDPDDPTRANVQVGSLEYMPPQRLVDSSHRSTAATSRVRLHPLRAGAPAARRSSATPPARARARRPASTASRRARDRPRPPSRRSSTTASPRIRRAVRVRPPRRRARLARGARRAAPRPARTRCR